MQSSGSETFLKGGKHLFKETKRLKLLSVFIEILSIFTFWLNSPTGRLSPLDFNSSLCPCTSKLSNCDRGEEEKGNEQQQQKSFPPARRPLPWVLAVSLSASRQLFQTCLRARALPNKVDKGRRLERRREGRTGGGATVCPNRWLCSS